MKSGFKVLIVLLSVGAALFSCKKIKEEAPSDVEVTLTASIGAEDSKVVVDSDGASLLWSPSEKIKVFRGAYSAEFTAEATSTSKTAVFKGTLPAGASGDFWAVCPYSSDSEFSSNTITTTVPDAQKSSEGSFISGTFPILAHSTNNQMSFYNLCGGAKFTVSESGIKKIVIEGNAGEVIAGKVKVKFNSDGKPVVDEVKDGKTSITLTPNDGTTFKTDGTYYYAVMLPVALESGIKISYYKDLGVAVFLHNSAMTINRSKFGKILNKEAGLDFITPFTALTTPGEYSGCNTATPQEVTNDSDQTSICKKVEGDNPYLRYTMLNESTGNYIQVDMSDPAPTKGSSQNLSVSRNGVQSTPTMTVSRVNDDFVWIENTEDGKGFIIPLK